MSQQDMEMGLAILTCGVYDVTLWLHTDVDPSQQEWDAAIDRIRALKQKRGGDLSNIRALAFSDGGAPNVIQRGQLFSDLYEGKSKSAAVTTALTNRLKRGIATAISWINPSFHAFPPDELGKALAHLDLQDHQEVILKSFTELQRGMRPNQTLEMVLSTNRR